MLDPKPQAIPLDQAPATVLDALREPERLVRAWRDHGTRAYPAAIFPLLLAVTGAGTAAYGLVMGLPLGWTVALERAVAFPLAAGAAWALALPTFYIVGNMAGLRLDASTTLLAATLTVHYAALAMIASIPVNLFFASALAPVPGVLVALNFVIFAGVGACAADVLVRVVREVDPDSVGFAKFWLALIGVLGAELFSIAGIFRF